jgi:two-component system chemotaxis response regulator CheB
MKPIDPSAPVRVLLVESMRSARHLLSTLIELAPELTLVGVASNTNEALELATRLRPAVIAMNTHVLGSDGFTLTQQVMRVCPTPVVLFCATLSPQVSDAATAAGALTVIQLPGSQTAVNHDHDSAIFLKTLRVMAGVPVVTRFVFRPSGRNDAARDANGQPYALLAIAASTGGPSAIQRVVSQFGPAFPLPIVLVQHIASTFVQSLADWLNSVTAMPVKVVHDAQKLQPGHIYLAPSNHHLLMRQRGWATVQSSDDTEAAYCPSADLLFQSVAQTYGPRAIGLILSGMGDDGARGLAAMRQSGSLTLAQDEASCVVYGMPQAAVLANAVQQVGSLDELAAIITRHSSHR